MSAHDCEHAWEMTDVTHGFMVTEECSHCQQIATYFAFDNKPPLEQHREGKHLWNFRDSAQTIRFNLRCTRCGFLVELKELLGFMLCTGCDAACEVDRLRRQLEPQRTWVYVAFEYLPLEKRGRLGPEKIAILEEYFNQRRKSAISRIKIVSSELVRTLAMCYGEVIRDVALLSLTPPEDSVQG